MQYAVTWAICRVVTPKEERYPSPFTKQNAQGLRLNVGRHTHRKGKKSEPSYKEIYRKKSLKVNIR